MGAEGPSFRSAWTLGVDASGRVPAIPAVVRQIVRPRARSPGPGSSRPRCRRAAKSAGSSAHASSARRRCLSAAEPTEPEPAALCARRLREQITRRGPVVVRRSHRLHVSETIHAATASRESVRSKVASGDAARSRLSGYFTLRPIPHTPPCRAPLLIEGISKPRGRSPLYQEGWCEAPGCVGSTSASMVYPG